MSKRRKNARADRPAKVRDVFVPRPFEGLADECEWIALRELVPAASAPLRLTAAVIERFGDRPVTLATVLPMAWPAMSRQDGTVLIGLQRHVQSGDPSRDLAVAILCGLQTAPGNTVGVPTLPGEGPRLQEVLIDGPLDITVHDSFEFWLAGEAGGAGDAGDAGDAGGASDAGGSSGAGGADETGASGASGDPNVKASLERANASIYPTVRLDAAPAAYWCRVSDKGHIRWVLPQDEDLALDGLARLSAVGGVTLGDGTRFAGMFRAHGRLVPVWDLPLAAEAASWEVPLAEFVKRYGEAVSAPADLTPAERRARQGLVGRQLTLR